MIYKMCSPFDPEFHSSINACRLFTGPIAPLKDDRMRRRTIQILDDSTASDRRKPADQRVRPHCMLKNQSGTKRAMILLVVVFRHRAKVAPILGPGLNA